MASWGQKAVAALPGGSVENVRLKAIVLEEEGLRVSFGAEAVDRVGCAIAGLSIKDLRSVERDVGNLAAWADRVAGRITYLLEKIAIIEVDAASGSALLRSARPERRGEARAYYEVVLTIPGTLTLTRYRYHQGEAKRVEIPCNLTLEVFERLVDDLVATMREPVG